MAQPRLVHAGSELWVAAERYVGANSNSRIDSPPAPLGERSFADRPDDTDGPQIHLMYVLPSDGIDKHLDTDGTLDLSVRSFQRWFQGQTNGTSLHLDTYQGQPDITFVRLAQTDLSIRAAVCPDLVTRAECTLAWNVIQGELIDRQLTQPNKIYAVYYGGGNVMCGSAPTPPSWPGIVAVLYLNGQPPGSRSCATYPFTTGENTPGFFELNMVHEILHTLGIVPACAPHHFGPHVSDDPRDLMYQGPLPWEGQILDVGHDDYYLHGMPGCPDLKDSAFLLPAVNEPSMPPRWGELPRVISLAIDNTPLISSNDATYSSGSHWISAGIVSGTSDVRLDNLLVRQR